jgi:type IV secretory pathway component VirB8
MSASSPPADVLVARDQGLAELKAVLAEVRRDENSRKWWSVATHVVPWAIAGMASLYALGAGLLVYSRPVPKDHFMIAVMHDDRTYDPPVERDSLPVDKQKILLEYTAIRVVQAWEGYAWRANQGNYRFISAVTAGEDLRKQYQDRFAEGAPGNLDDKYGPDVTRDVAALQIIPVPHAPNALDFMALIKLRKAGSITCQRWRGRMTFKDDEKHLIPLEVQKLYDPMDIIFTSYESTVDPAAPEITGCAA